MVIQHAVNQGVGKSFQDGLIYSLEKSVAIMVNFDPNLQYNPTNILVQTIVDVKADFGTADRFNDEKGRIPQPALLISKEELEKTPKD